VGDDLAKLILTPVILCHDSLTSLRLGRPKTVD
jgi:hypothetical protein